MTKLLRPLALCICALFIGILSSPSFARVAKPLRVSGSNHRPPLRGITIEVGNRVGGDIKGATLALGGFWPKDTTGFVTGGIFGFAFPLNADKSYDWSVSRAESFYKSTYKGSSVLYMMFGGFLGYPLRLNPNNLFIPIWGLNAGIGVQSRHYHDATFTVWEKDYQVVDKLSATGGPLVGVIFRSNSPSDPSEAVTIKVTLARYFEKYAITVGLGWDL